MAELGIAASVIQLADLGVRLSLRLYTFGKTVASADKSIISISKDVSLTSSVLKELGQWLEKDQESRVHSENAVQAADEIVKECLEVFNSMDKALTRSMSRLGLQEGGRNIRTVAALERLKWPFLQPRMQFLRSNLEKLKSTLLLMLNVLTYGRQLKYKNEPQSIIDNQRALIEDLARSNMEYSRKYEDVALAIEASQSKKVERSQSAERPSAGISRSINITNSVIDDLPDKIDMSNSRDLGLDKQKKSQGLKVGEVMEEMLSHYCDLVNHLLEEVDSAKYRIRKDIRSRIRDDVVHTHKREREYLRTLHGDKKLKRAIMGKALNCVESDITVLESQSSETATTAFGTPESNRRRGDSQDQGLRLETNASLTDATHEARARRTILMASIGSSVKKSFRLPFQHVNSLVFKRRQAPPLRETFYFPHLEQPHPINGAQIKRRMVPRPNITPGRSSRHSPPIVSFNAPDHSAMIYAPFSSAQENHLQDHLRVAMKSRPRPVAPSLYNLERVTTSVIKRKAIGPTDELTTHLHHLGPHPTNKDDPAKTPLVLHERHSALSDETPHRPSRGSFTSERYHSDDYFTGHVRHMDQLRVPANPSREDENPVIDQSVNQQESSAQILSESLAGLDPATSRQWTQTSYFSPPRSSVTIVDDIRRAPRQDYKIDNKSSQADVPAPKVRDIVDDLLEQWTTLKLDTVTGYSETK